MGLITKKTLIKVIEMNVRKANLKTQPENEIIELKINIELIFLHYF